MPPKSYSFALGSSDRPASGLWRLWIQEDDVHLEVQTSRQLLAFTAYRTGRWRISAGDAVSRWTRPKEFRPGWIRGPDLLIPGSPKPLASSAVSPAAEAPAWLSLPKPGELARFTMLFAGPRSSASTFTPTEVVGTELLAVLSLRTAGVVHFCRRDELNDDPDTPPPGVTPSLSVRISANQAGTPSLRETYGAA